MGLYTALALENTAGNTVPNGLNGHSSNMPA